MTGVRLICCLLLSSQAVAETLPVPPIPPAIMPGNPPAPIPDRSVEGPITTSHPSPSVGLQFYRTPSDTPGYGFAAGSRYQPPEDRKPLRPPGVSITVPLN